MVAELWMVFAAILTFLAELLHTRRVNVVAPLAFGPRRRPELWVAAVPLLRAGAMGALVWGLVTLMSIEAKVHKAEQVKAEEQRHLLLVLDVSPSMRLQDAGPTKKQSRMQRARDLMASFFRRVPMAEYRSTVIAVYNGAKPVVVASRDLNIVRNILNDLPMHYAFRSGKTDLFAGLKEAAKVARGWRPRSATVLVISDGDTIPATGMPEMPASVSDVVVVGVGDPVTGKFIDGRQSRQDRSTLRQLAVRLSGRYHNGNEKHLSSELLAFLTRKVDASPFDRLTRREYALIACAVGALLLALIPLALALAGTRFRPGHKPAESVSENRRSAGKLFAQGPTSTT